MGSLILLGKLLYFFLPAGVANMSPVLLQNRLVFLNRPVDGGVQWKGKALFGAHKTWRGLIVATFFGGCFFLLQYGATFLLPFTLAWSPFTLRDFPWWFGFVFAAGAIGGDLVKSFFKRRVNIAPGKSWFPFDQLDFIFGAMLVASFFIDFTLHMWFVIIVAGIFFHILVNYIGYWIHLKDSPW